MKGIMHIGSWVFLAVGVLALMVAGCSTNTIWPADMADQPAIQPLMAPRPAPEGAVPVKGVEHLDDREDDTDLTNPYPQGPQALKVGEKLFGVQCAICHGAAGQGHGKLDKVFPPAPDLRFWVICKRSDGFIYGTITAGGRAMPTMREGLSSRERWALVDWVRHIQAAGCTGRRPSRHPQAVPANTNHGEAP